MSTELELFVRIKYAVPYHYSGKNREEVDLAVVYPFLMSLPRDFLLFYHYAYTLETDSEWDELNLYPVRWSIFWIEDLVTRLVDYEQRREDIH